MRVSNKRAFTLLEILVATILVAIIALMFFTSLAASCNYLRRIIELRTANLILQEQMSMVRELKYADIQTLGGSFTSSSMASLKNATGSINKSYFYLPSGKIIKITFRLGWTNFLGANEYKSIVTLITDKGINKK